MFNKKVNIQQGTFKDINFLWYEDQVTIEGVKCPSLDTKYILYTKE